MTQNRHPAGTSIGGEFAPGAASEVDEELGAPDDHEGVEEVLRGYSDACFRNGDSPDPEVMKAIGSASSREEAEEVIDRLDLRQAIDRPTPPGTGPKSRARSIRSGYVINRIKRGLRPSRAHLRAIDDFTKLSDDSAERFFDGFMRELRSWAN